MTKKKTSKKFDELLERALALPLEERKWLIDQLIWSFGDEDEQEED